MSFREWAMACGTNRASCHGRPLLAAEVGYELGKVQQNLVRLFHRVMWPLFPGCCLDLSQLQLNKWSTSHSLWINTWQLHEAAKVSPAQFEQLKAVASKLPVLQCLHIIGRPEMPLTKGSIEEVLVSLLAKHALVLTLQVKRVQMPLEFPALQHLVVDIDSAKNYRPWWEEDIEHSLFEAISMLKGLKTLYLQSSDGIPICATDLTGSVHLTHIAVQGIILVARDKLALPAGCLLHAHSAVHQVCQEVSEDVAPLVTGLTIGYNPSYGGQMSDINRWDGGWVLRYTPQMERLKRLRLLMTKECIDEKSSKEGVLKVHFKSGLTPNLEILELNMPCGVEVEMDPIPPLKVLVIISTGTLHLHKLIHQAPPTLKHMYLQSGKAFPPDYRTELEESCAQEPRAELRLLEYLIMEQDSWTAQMPKGFQPSNLKECYCGACPECLARAGVPILCDQAWTRDGFEKHLRHHCNRNV